MDVWIYHTHLRIYTSVANEAKIFEIKFLFTTEK